MYWRAGHAPRRLSLLGLVLRTLAAFVLGGLLAALLISLIRSDGIYQEGVEGQHALNTAVDVRLLPTSNTKLMVDSRKDRAGDSLRSRLFPEMLQSQKQTSLYETEAFRQQLEASATEPTGNVYRLASSLEHPLGAPPASNPVCMPFNSSTRTVGIIGNGPIAHGDRLQIETYDVVIRFNLMNNWQRFREKIDVWVMRHSTEATAGFWGINNIEDDEAYKILSMLKGVWLVGGNQTHADTLLKNHPVMGQHTPVLMPEAPMNKAFAADLLRSPNSYPSTGMVGIQAVLYCTLSSVKLHIYGFNWSRKTWAGHNVSAEQEYIFRLQAEGRAVVHATACEGMRECGDGDIDASCHWSTDGRYMCLRGKPQRWKDMTLWVTDERMREYRTDVSHKTMLGVSDGAYK